MKDKILDIIRSRGPMLPSDLAKQLKTNTMFIGAHLSEMVSSKKMLVSNLKIGSSPLYYLNGQQARLQVFYKYLNDKDKMAFDLLKKEKVLRDKDQQPITRVSLRSIKDFAVPLNINANGEKEIFWKWYLLDNKEAEPLIRKELEGGIQREINIAGEKARIEEERKKSEDEEKKKEAESSKRKQEEEKSKAEELRKQIEEDRQKLEEEKKQLEEERKKIGEERKRSEKREVLKKEEQMTLREESKKEQIMKGQQDDPFLSEIRDYCSKNKITVIGSKVVKNKSDIELTIKVPSVVGEVMYFCKARNKKKVSDGDLSSALVKGQLKKLPVLFLGKGDLTKNAEKELDGDLKGHIIFKKI